MLNWILRTDDDRVATLLRLGLGAVILPHGLQKVFGWFGGAGVSGTLGSFEQYFGVPAVLATLVIAGEFLGSLGLITGFLTRVAAIGISLVMLGAVYLVHLHNGFFMNWTGAQPGEGFEYHLLALAIAFAIAIKGGGAYSVDRIISRRFAASASVEEPARAVKRHAA
jgi:putative oxidoreductase